MPTSLKVEFSIAASLSGPLLAAPHNTAMRIESGSAHATVDGPNQSAITNGAKGRNRSGRSFCVNVAATIAPTATAVRPSSSTAPARRSSNARKAPWRPANARTSGVVTIKPSTWLAHQTGSSSSRENPNRTAMQRAEARQAVATSSAANKRKCFGRPRLERPSRSPRSSAKATIASMKQAIRSRATAISGRPRATSAAKLVERPSARLPARFHPCRGARAASSIARMIPVGGHMSAIPVDRSSVSPIQVAIATDRANAMPF